MQQNLYSQNLTIDRPDFFYQIAPAYDFKEGIVSLTFDDGSMNQFLVALPMLKRQHIPATFYLITNSIDSLTRSIIKDNFSFDYEFASHTFSHKNLLHIGADEAKSELVNSQIFLQRIYGKNAGLTLSYPYGLYNKQIQGFARDTYLAARSSDPGFNSLQNLNRFSIKGMGFGKKTLSSQANSWIDFVIRERLWLVETIHGINGIGFSPVDTNEFEKHLEYLNKTRDGIWISTLSNVIKYIDEANNTKIKTEIINDSVYKVFINDNLDDSIYNQPLSIKLKVPSGWENISIDEITNYKIAENNGVKYIFFNRCPDDEPLTLRIFSKSLSKKESEMSLVFISENPFLDKIRVSVEVYNASDIKIEMIDMEGRILVREIEKSATGIIDFFFDTSGVRKGMYLMKISNLKNGSNIIRKMIKI